MESDLVARQGGIDVWLACYDEFVDERILSNFREIMSEEERLQEARYHFAHDRKRYRVTRAMVRTVLSRYVPLAPVDWKFSANRYGRPEIANDHEVTKGLHFSISHTRGLIALAISKDRALGIDVEDVMAHQASLDIAQKFFSPAEFEELSRVPGNQRHGRFLEYWTLKESYIKARGMGLSIPLDKFSVHGLHQRAVRMSIHPELNDDANRWIFWQFHATVEHLLAICAERMGDLLPTVAMRRIMPTGVDEKIHIELLRHPEPHHDLLTSQTP